MARYVLESHEEQLSAAAADGNTDYLREAFETHAAHPNARPFGTPLVVKAAWMNKWGTVEFLLDAGARPNDPAPGGLTALMAAAANGHARVVEILMDFGADETLKEGDLGWTALDYAQSYGHKEAAAAIERKTEERASSKIVRFPRKKRPPSLTRAEGPLSPVYRLRKR